MTSLNKLIWDVKLLLRGGAVVSDDDPISDEQVAFWIHAARAVLIRQQLDKGQSVSTNVIQGVIIPMEQINTGYQSSLLTDCWIARSINPIPKPIETKQTDTIYNISAPAYGIIPYTKLPPAVMPYSKYNPFGKNIPKAYLNNSYLIIENIDYIENVYIDIIAADPSELGAFNTPDVTCFDPDQAYPISEHMIDPLKRLIIDTNFRYTLKNLNDSTNNASHNLEEPVK